MIDLFSAWFGGFLLSMLLCGFVVKEFPQQLKHRVVPLIILAMCWPIIILVVIYWMWK